MRILVMKNGNPIAEVEGQRKAAELLGWPARRVSEIVRSGESYEGITIDYIPDRTRQGESVCAYTPTGVCRFKSLNECARVYGISRKKLMDLIETGATHRDGITTFDMPIA